jgi:hypothetical protein
MSDEIWPDVEGGLRTWLRANAGVSGLVGQRVFLAVPPSAPATAFVTVARIGGGDTAGSSVPVDNALVSIDCWGVLGDDGRPHWRDCGALVNAVRSALGRIDGRTALASGVAAFGVQVAGVVRAPDPADGRPRYTITAEVTAMATAP